ncbi:MAG: DUF4159 domain-containing protein [Bradymonadaceae bacterium]|nr:DUF4159 domain-containing protein [Lujinxingiaceae bacterium]
MNRRQFLLASAALGALAAAPGPLLAMGESDRFAIALLNYGTPGWNPRPSALRRLLLEVEKRTSIEVRPDPRAVSANSAELFDTPFLVLAGDRGFEPFSQALVDQLRAFTQAGGFLFIDSAEGVIDGPFAKSVEREIARIFPRRKLAVVPRDHVVFKSFYLIEQPMGRLAVSPTVQGIFDEDRLLAVVSHNDLLGALARDNFGNWEFSVTPGGDRQRELAYRFGINLVMYALTVNYKADQVHIPFILKRRRWRVD